ncbi:hypothetical protein BBJ28_00014012 [Nothophytophthora sp. Chile5]|nr:hypothetical protein BBJ28_00014012 [Nothophytophthora sp. Chile5]
MRSIDARVTGFDYTAFHAYTTEVEVDGRDWTLAIRYNTFFQFYTRLAALEKHFTVAFPPKGGLFFSPPPEERQEQLDDFMLSTLAYFDMRGHPKRMEALLGELLQIPEHMDVKDDEERTASEGSSVADELLLDTPMPGHEEEAGDFDDEQDDETDLSAAIADFKLKREPVEAKPKPEQVKPKETTGAPVAKDYLELLRRKATLVSGAIQAAVVATMQENVDKAKVEHAKAQEEEQKAESLEALSDVAKTPDVEVATSAEPEATVTEADDVLEEKVQADAGMLEEQPMAELVEEKTQVIEAIEEKPAASTEPVIQSEEALPVVESETESTIEPTVETPAIVEEAVVEASAPAEKVAVTDEETSAPVDVVEAEGDAVLETPAVETAAVPVDTEEAPIAAESIADSVAATSTPETETEAEVKTPIAVVEEATEPAEEIAEAEAEHPVVNWFRRLGTFGQASSVEEEAPQSAASEESAVVEKEAAVAAAKEEEAAAAAKAQAEAEAEAQAKAETEEEARLKIEAKLLRAEQEMNLRLKRYRHPVFFQGFNCDVGTSRYSLPRQSSSGVLV